jgi:dephospho-CoA kinase
MIRWAVTGPTGAGKSRLTALLAARGAAVVDGDALGHEILARPEVRAGVAREFGPGFVADGAVDRRGLGALVFADRGAMLRLNALTHGPLARLAEQRLDALEAAGQHVLAVFEAAVYFLLPSPPRVARVITVTAPPPVRAARLAAKLGLSGEEAASRVAFQSFMEEGWRKADLVFDNRGDEAALESFAAELWSQIPAP